MDDLQTKRHQVAEQCRAIAHMADIIGKVHADYGRLFGDGAAIMAGLEDQVGERTVVVLETLGDILNNLDAVEDDDAWVNPIMARAREVFPEKQCPTCGKSIPHAEHGTAMGTRYHIACLPPCST